MNAPGTSCVVNNSSAPGIGCILSRRPIPTSESIFARDAAVLRFAETNNVVRRQVLVDNSVNDGCGGVSPLPVFIRGEDDDCCKLTCTLISGGGRSLPDSLSTSFAASIGGVA